MAETAHGDGAHGGVAEELDAAECLRLVAGQQIGRIRPAHIGGRRITHPG